MAKRGFFCYRRYDTDFAAFFLKSELEAIFGNSFFIDNSDLQLGVDFPLELKKELDGSAVLLLVMGRSWLQLDDQWGRRRIDADTDWVRYEIQYALDKQLPIIPILVGGAKMPPPEALPSTISHISNYQAFELQDLGWRDQLSRLVNALQKLGFVGPAPSRLHPKLNPDARVPLALADQELNDAMTSIPAWELRDTYNAGGHPKTLTHIERAFSFKSFRTAIRFMDEMARYCDEPGVRHHPDWRNVWRTVIVRLSTWDIGSQVSRLDVALARKFDDVYATRYVEENRQEEQA